MALRATIYKAELQIADMDRGHYADYSLTLARHPSETDERLMVRLFAFALCAAPGLQFGRGLSTADEADLYELDATGRARQWIDVGLPDEKAIRRAARQSDTTVVIAYGARAVDVWWANTAGAVAGLRNLRVLRLEPEASRGLAEFSQRNMRLQCTIQEGSVWFTDGERQLEISPVTLLQPEAG